MAMVIAAGPACGYARPPDASGIPDDVYRVNSPEGARPRAPACCGWNGVRIDCRRDCAGGIVIVRMAMVLGAGPACGYARPPDAFGVPDDGLQGRMYGLVARTKIIIVRMAMVIATGPACGYARPPDAFGIPDNVLPGCSPGGRASSRAGM